MFGLRIPLLIAGGWGVAASSLTEAAAPTGITLSNDTFTENLQNNVVVAYLTATDPDPGDTHVYEYVSGEGDEANGALLISGNQLRSIPGVLYDYELWKPTFTIRVKVTDSSNASFVQVLTMHILDDREEDADHDGLTEAQEEDVYGTSDVMFDSDGDGVGDAAELGAGTSPTNADDWPAGSLIGWGKASEGEQSMPVGAEFMAVATGQAHSVAMTVDGAIAGWGGYGIFGQTTPPAGLTDVVALAAGGDYWLEDSAHSLALRSDGSVVVWGYDHGGMIQIPEGLGPLLSIDAGRSHCIGLKADGTVATWGYNPFGSIEPPSNLQDVVAVSAGGYYCLALKGDGTVVAWGSNYNGYKWEPAKVPVGLADVVGISAGRFHSLALKQDGTVVAWGLNENGQTEVPEGLDDVTAVSAGGFHSLALRSDGSVVAWGSNSYGQLVVPVAAQSGVRLISAGLLHSLAARQSDSIPSIESNPTIVVTPGVPMEHQVAIEIHPETEGVVFSAIGLPPGLSIDAQTGMISGTATSAARRTVRIQATIGSQIVTQNIFVAVTEGQAPTAVNLTPASVMENSPAGTVVGTLGAVDPDAGDSHTFEWVDGPGSDDNGMFRIEGDQLIVDKPITRDFETNPTGFTIRVRARDASLNPYEQVIQIALSDDRSEDADGDGLSEQQETDVYGTSDTKTDTDGDGFGDKFELDRGISPVNPNEFPSGRMLVAWGFSDEEHPIPHQLMNDVIDVSAGELHSLALKSDGTVVAWGGNEHGQTDLPENLEDVIAVKAGAIHSLALTSDGQVIAWGNNDVGQTAVPASLTGVVEVSAGGYHNLALAGDGTVTAWGSNEYGQASVPAGLAGVVAVAAGGFHSLALREDGTVAAWGSDWEGAATVPAGLNGVIAIAAGGYHSLALRYDGTVVAWGDYTDGQTTVPDGLVGVTEIAAGWRHSVALLGDGTVVAWGGGDYGQTKVPAEAKHIRKIVAGNFHNLAIRENSGFPAFADISPISGWPGETLEKPVELANAEVEGSFSAMGLPAELSLDPDSGIISGTVTSGGRRAVRISVPTDQGLLSRVIWLDTLDGVAATDIVLLSSPLSENSPSGTVVGTLSAVDPNVGDFHVFEVLDVAWALESYHFIVVGNTLKLALPLNVDFDAGVTQVTIRVAAVDLGNNRFEKDFILQVTDDRGEDSDGDGLTEAEEEDVFGTSDLFNESPNTADGDKDGVPGVIELAFNLDPKVAGPPVRLIAGAGSTAGLPAVDLVSDGQGRHRLRMEYLRRIGGGMIYTPQFGSDLGPGGWQTVEPAVTPVDAIWERCVVMDSVTTEDAPRRFGRVAVQFKHLADRTQDVDGDGINQELEEDVFGTSDWIANDFGNEDTDHDGVPGVIEYAFNLDPKIASPMQRLVPDGGSTVGLPAITLVDDGAGGWRLRIEYLRRIGSILTYTPQFAGGLDPGDWKTAANPVAVTSIDGEWERCVVEDTASATSTERRFARVAVSW